MRWRIGLFIFCFFFSFAAFGLTPPWPQEKLQADSDLIVEGEVLKPVQCLGLVDQNKCSDKLKYTVPMKIQKVIKGEAKAGQTIKIVFYRLDYGKSNCVGDQYAVLHSGDQGTYYLRKSGDEAFSPVHWSGAQVKVPGSGGLPKCP